jgi:hypothetical protein
MEYEYNGIKYYENFFKIKHFLIKDYKIGNITEEKFENINSELNELIQKEKEQKEIDFWKNFNRKFVSPEDVPILPRGEIYEKYVIPALIRSGAIQKKDLKIGGYYYGEWRRGNFGRWDGEKFHIWREKFGYWRINKANHFEDDDEFALFVPLKEITEEEYNNRNLIIIEI